LEKKPSGTLFYITSGFFLLDKHELWLAKSTIFLPLDI
jgi:hypothetical protein